MSKAKGCSPIVSPPGHGLIADDLLCKGVDAQCHDGDDCTQGSQAPSHGGQHLHRTERPSRCFFDDVEIGESSALGAKISPFPLAYTSRY